MKGTSTIWIKEMAGALMSARIRRNKRAMSSPAIGKRTWEMAATGSAIITTKSTTSAIGLMTKGTGKVSIFTAIENKDTSGTGDMIWDMAKASWFPTVEAANLEAAIASNTMKADSEKI